MEGNLECKWHDMVDQQILTEEAPLADMGEVADIEGLHHDPALGLVQDLGLEVEGADIQGVEVDRMIAGLGQEVAVGVGQEAVHDQEDLQGPEQDQDHQNSREMTLNKKMEQIDGLSLCIADYQS